MDSDGNQRHHQNQEEEGENERIHGTEVEDSTAAAMEAGEGEGGGDPTDDIMIGIDGDDLIFSDDAFPSLPDFPCLPSPTASSTSKFPTTTNHSHPSMSSSSSTSSSSSWNFLAVPGHNQEPYMQMVPTPTASDDIDIFGDIEMWDPSNPIDPSFLFPDDYDTAIEQTPPPPPAQPPPREAPYCGNEDEGCGAPSEELAKIFLDWLKSNRDSISPEDLRSIKLKKSTIECAAARLGGGKQGKTQLLKLILTWVQNHHLQKKKRRLAAARYCGDRQEAATETMAQQVPCYPHYYPQQQFPILDGPTNPNPSGFDYSCEVPSLPVHYTGENPMPVSALPTVCETPMYQNSPAVVPYQYYQGGGTSQPPFSPSPDFSQAYSPTYPSPFAATAGMPHPNPAPHYPAVYAGSSYSVYPSPSLAAGTASATKEARKKRMARQRRFSALHRHRNQNHNNQHSSEGGGGSSVNSKNWPFLNPNRQKNLPANRAPGRKTAPSSNLPQPQPPQSRNAAPSDKREGGKSEKKLRFLLQKVLKQSDVGSLGRIVLPKKEAESHLPELETRDGISIPMEDIGTSRVWHMKYRFWPNNKSRMYLLENTGDFVRANGLQEGDFIVIYSDARRDKYMIRGVKVRQPAEAKGAASSGPHGAAKITQHKNGFHLENHENGEVELHSYSEEDEDASP